MCLRANWNRADFGVCCNCIECENILCNIYVQKRHTDQTNRSKRSAVNDALVSKPNKTSRRFCNGLSCTSWTPDYVLCKHTHITSSRAFAFISHWLSNTQWWPKTIPFMKYACAATFFSFLFLYPKLKFCNETMC